MSASPFRTWRRLRPLRRAHDTRGLALVETAVVLVVLAVILLALMQFSYVFYVHQSMEDAAHDAARVAAGRNGSSGDAMSAAQARLSGLPYAFDVQVQIPREENSLNRDVRVSISTPMRGLSFGLLGSGDLRAQVTMRRDGSGV